MSFLYNQHALERIMTPYKYIALTTATLLTTTVNAEEWQRVQDIPGDKGVYETILIERTGLINKEVSIWLRANYKLDESSCAKNSSDSLSEKTQSMNVYCIARTKNEPKESVYKVTLNCSDGKVSHTLHSSINHDGKPVHDDLNIGEHPGSLGFSLLQYHCR